MENNRFDFTSLLPLEVVEEIFQNLSSNDLVNCSLVCVKWRELVNNNRIWARLCQRDGIHEKEPLKTEESLLPNPTKKFKAVANTSERLSDVCHWRSHYDRYRYLRVNWKKGYCALHQLDVTGNVYPTYYNDGIMVILLEGALEVHLIRGTIKKLCFVELKYPGWPVHTVLVSGDLIIYSQKKKIFGLRREDDRFRDSFQIDVCDGSDSSDNINSSQNQLLIKRAENYVVVSDMQRPGSLFIWNTNTGKLEREVELEKGRGKVKCYCLEALALRVYIAYSVNKCHFVSEYDLVKNTWGAKLSVPFTVRELYVTREILCAKVEVDDLYVWSLHDMTEVANIPMSDNRPIALTNDVVLYCKSNTINVRSLQTTFQSNFRVPADMIVNMFAVGNHLLVINTGVAIEVWDWGTGEKLYTPYRGVCNNSMWVDDRMIIMNKWSCNYEIIAYW